MIFIIVEPSYSKSIWCCKLLAGLETELKYKRIAYRYISAAEELDEKCKYIYVVGSAAEWIQAVLDLCSRVKLHPILLSNRSDQRFPANYSAVCSDTVGSMQCLVDRLYGTGQKRIALYGINPASAADESRKSAFFHAVKSQDSSDLFFNNGSLEACFHRFLQRSHGYDTVICANDFAAISLVRHLSEEAPEELRRLTVIGCAETRLTEYYCESVQSIRINFEEYGPTAVALLEMLRRNPCVSNIVMTIRWDFGTIGAPPEKAAHMGQRPAVDIPQAEDAFYQDLELHDMMCVERILNEMDDLDERLLPFLLADQSNEWIAEHCFTTVSTVKYHIRKMAAAAQKQNKRELIQLLRKFLPMKDGGGERT